MSDYFDREAGLRALAVFKPANFNMSAYASELRKIMEDLSIIGGKETVQSCLDYFANPAARGASTIQSYVSCLRTQEKYNRDFILYENSRSYQVHRAALVYQANTLLYTALFNGCRYLRGELKPASDSEVTQIAESIEGPICELQSIRSSTPRRTIRHSKGKDSLLLRQLPIGWHNELLTAIASDPTYGPAVAILCLTGARPSEFGGQGIFVTRDEAGRLLLRINGKKVRAGAGQPWRRARIPRRDNPAAQYLHHLIEASGRKGVYVKLRSVELLSRRITETAYRLWPNLWQNLSATTFRKMVASEMKAAGWPRHQIALMLGHINTRTQAWYGSSVFGSGADFWVDQVTAPRVVKMSSEEWKAVAEGVARVNKIRNSQR